MDYATNLNDHRSISGGRDFVNGTLIVTWILVMLSMTEAEIAAGKMIAQDMLYLYHLLESLELKVELPILLEIDNSGAVDVANSWSVGDRTGHVVIQNYFYVN